MPWSDRLGMFVRSPEEGVQEGQYAGNIFAHAADQGAAQYQQSLENKLKAAATLKRTMALREMADRIDEYMDIPGVTETDAQKRAFFDVAPQLFHDNPQALAGVYTAQVREEQGLAKLKRDAEVAASRVKLNEAMTKKAERIAEPTLAPAVREARDQAIIQNRVAQGDQLLQPSPQPDQTEPAREPVSFPGMFEASPQNMTTAPIPITPQAREQLAIDKATLANLEAKRSKKTEDVMPTIQEVGGVELIVNPKTGHFERTEKTVTKSQFITQNLSKWMKDLGIDEDQASKRLGKFYDDNISAQPKLAKQPPKVGTTVIQNGIKYQYQGGLTNSPASWLKVP